MKVAKWAPAAPAKQTAVQRVTLVRNALIPMVVEAAIVLAVAL